MTSKQRCVVAVYATHVEAENGVKELQKCGSNMKQCSIVGRGLHSEEEVVGFYNVGERMKLWGKQGAFWGGIWGCLVGAGYFWIPGVGTVLAGGALVSSIIGALEGAAVVGTLNALGAGLYSVGIPRNSVLEYETAVKTSKFLVIFHGTAGEIAKAKEILDSTQQETVAVLENVLETEATPASASVSA